MTDPAAPTTDLVGLTADIVSAYVANNKVGAEALPDLIASTHAAFAGLGAARAAARQDADPAPAVSVRKSLASRDHIVSLIDGKPYRTLKRHLAGHGLTPDDYRARYKLPADYPMVAPAYSEQRSALARQLGLGRKAASAAPATPAKTARMPRAKRAQPA